jgi:hypothetical protein
MSTRFESIHRLVCCINMSHRCVLHRRALARCIGASCILHVSSLHWCIVRVGVMHRCVSHVV